MAAFKRSSETESHDVEPAREETAASQERRHEMMPPAPRGGPAEWVFMRLVATVGIVGIATALGAILVGEDVAG